MRHIISFLIYVASNLCTLTSHAQADLHIDIVNLRNGRGDIKLALFKSSIGFPQKDEKAIYKLVIPIKDQLASFTFYKLPPGIYAFVAYHDENGNDRLDKNFLGIPKEGIAASNNARNMFGPPHFNDAKFSINNKEMRMKVRMTYW